MVELPVVDVPVPGLLFGSATPCCLRQLANAARAALALFAVVVAAAFLLGVLLAAPLELEPQAATHSAASAATSIATAPRGMRLLSLMVSIGPFVSQGLGAAHPPPNSELIADDALLPVLPLVDEDPVPPLRAPESVREVAVTVPFAPWLPWITTSSPGKSLCRDTLSGPEP